MYRTIGGVASLPPIQSRRSMRWRRWLIRCLLFGLLALVVGGYFVYQRWTDPTVVRQVVLQQLRRALPTAQIHLGSAELRLLGGIRLYDLVINETQDGSPVPVAILPEVLLFPDKEELASGRLILRKVEIHRPQLTLVREADGRWNLARLVRDRDTGLPMPLIQVRSATVRVVDHLGGGEPTELTAIDMTLRPGESGWLRVQATATHSLAGPVNAEGSVNRRTREAVFSFHLPRIEVGKPLLERLRNYFPSTTELGQVTGVAEVHAEVAYHPKSTPAWSHAIEASLRGGTWHHPDLPGPLTGVSLSGRLEGGRAVLDRFDARFGDARVHGSGVLESLDAHGDGHLQLAVDQYNVDAQSLDNLPKGIARLCRDFGVRGPVSASATVQRRQGQTTLRYTVKPLGVSIRYVGFPYPVDNVWGTLAYDDVPEPRMKVQLSGAASRQPVRIKGEVFGIGLRPGNPLKPGFELELTGANLPIDAKAYAALEPHPEALQVARSFNPSGRVNFRADLRRDPSRSENDRPRLRRHIILYFHQTALRYRGFPYPIEQAEGTLELRPDKSWRFSNFHGRHKGGMFQGSARFVPSADGNRLRVVIYGTRVLLDEEMRSALSPDMQTAWDLFHPGGRVDFAAQIDRVGQGELALDLRITARNSTMKPECFPYQLEQVTGSFNYRNQQVEVRNFRAVHGPTIVTLESADVDLRPFGGYRADLRQLHLEPLIVDREFLDAVPDLVRTAFATLKPDKPIRLVTDLVVESSGGEGDKRYYWDGHAAFADTRLYCGLVADDATGVIALKGSYDGEHLKAEGNVQLDQVTIARLPLRHVHSRLVLSRDSLQLPDFQATVYGGLLYGPIEVKLGNEVEYHVDLNASKVDVGSFARTTLGRSGEVRGKASARLHLRGKGDDLDSLQGDGWVHVAEGAKLYDLPLILNLLNFLSSYLPKGSAFQEAHANLVIRGQQIQLTELELLSDAISLRGLGKMKVDGTELDLEMYGLLWGRTLPLLPPLIDRIPVEVSKRLMTIRLKGDLANVKVVKEPVPIIVEPLKELWRRMNRLRQEGEESMGRPPPP